MRLHHAVLGLLGAAAFCLPGAAQAADEASKFSILQTIPGPDGGWDYASIDAAGRRLYVAHGDAVMSVDLDSGKVNPKVVDGNRLHAVLPLPDGKVLSTNGGNNTATIFEAATGKVIASVPTGTNPDAAILDPSSGLVLVMNGRSGDITLIDPKTATSPGRIDVGGKLEFAVADGKGKAYVNIEDKGEIIVIDVAGKKVDQHYPLPNCEEPSGMAYDPQTGVLVTACSNQKAIALEAKDGKVLASLPIGERPDAVMFDAKRHAFFIPCGAGSLAMISAEKGKTPAVVGTIPTQSGARTGALDPQTGKIYLPTADFGEPAAGEKRHPVIPGTFRILVVGEK